MPPHPGARLRRADTLPLSSLPPPSSPHRSRDRRRRVLAVRTFAGATAWLDGQPAWRDGRVVWETERGTLAPTAEDLSLAQRRLNKIAQYRLAAQQALGDAGQLARRRRARLELAKRLCALSADNLVRVAAQAQAGDGAAIDQLVGLLAVEAVSLSPLPVSPAATLAACGGRAVPATLAVVESQGEAACVRALAALVMGALDRRAVSPTLEAGRALAGDSDPRVRGAYRWSRQDGLPAHPGVVVVLLGRGERGTVRRCLSATSALRHITLPAARLGALAAGGEPVAELAALAEAALEADALVDEAARRRRMARRETSPLGEAGKRKRRKRGAAGAQAAPTWEALRDAAQALEREHARAAGALAAVLSRYAEKGSATALRDATRFARLMLDLGPWRVAQVEAAAAALAPGADLAPHLAGLFVSLLLRMHGRWWEPGRVEAATEDQARAWLAQRQHHCVDSARQGVVALGDRELIEEAAALDMVETLAHASLPGAAHYRYALRLVRTLGPDAYGYSVRRMLGALRTEDLPLVFGPLTTAVAGAPEALRGHFFAEVAGLLPDTRAAMLAAVPRLARLALQVAPVVNEAADAVHCLCGPCLEGGMEILQALGDGPEAGAWMEWLLAFFQERAAAEGDTLDLQRAYRAVPLALALSAGSLDRFARVLRAALDHKVLDDRSYLLDDGVKTLGRAPSLRGAAEVLGEAFQQRPRRCVRVLELLAGLPKLGPAVVETLSPITPLEDVPALPPEALPAGWRSVLETAPHLASLASAYVQARTLQGADGDVPAGVRKTLTRGQSQALELRHIEERLRREPERADLAARARMLRTRLAQEDAETAAARQEAAERLTQVVRDARLDALEHQVLSCYRTRLEALTGDDLRAVPMTDALLNAALLAGDVERNRPLLRRLLRAHLAGDRTWRERHPGNTRFLERAAASGLDVRQWLRRHPRVFRVPRSASTYGLLHVAVENDPLVILQMGTLFDTCLGVGGMNSFSAVANACELNKRVVYARGQHGQVLGRKLVGISTEGTLVGFRTYTSLSWNHGGAEVHRAFVRYCRLLAARCGLELSNSGTVPTLFAQGWYDDGVVPWEEVPTPEPGRPADRSA